MTSQTAFQPHVFSPGLTLRNRIVMAPMTTWSAEDDGTVSADEERYYRRRVGGVGLVITGCTHVSASGIGFTGEFAACDDRFLPSLRRLADAARSGGAPAVLQIFHAGVKSIPELIPGGDVLGASDSDGSNGTPVARGLSEAEIETIIQDFAAATRRAILAGFDGVELHGAHGFLLQNFLSPRFNRRTDVWGGSLENRLRFPLAVVAAVRAVIDVEADRPFVLGYRLSPEEPEADGLRLPEVEVLIDRLISARVGYIHASLADILQARPLDATDDLTIAERLVRHVADRAPLVAAGRIRTPDQAQAALALGLSLVAVGQGLVMNPDWVERASAGQEAGITTTLRTSQLAAIDLPDKLFAAIVVAPGWFDLEDDAKRLAA